MPCWTNLSLVTRSGFIIGHQRWSKWKGEKTLWKFKTLPSVGKVMAGVFWNNKSILLMEYFRKTQNINQHTYFDTLIKLRQAIKHPGKMSRKIVLLYNTCLHFAQTFHINAVQSPSLLIRFYLQWFSFVSKLKKWLGNLYYNTDVELRAAVDKLFWKQDASWYMLGIEKLVSRSVDAKNASICSAITLKKTKFFALSHVLFILLYLNKLFYFFSGCVWRLLELPS